MYYKIFINLILFIKNCFCIYFIYFFNILYYKIFYNHSYKCLKNFKVKGIKELYYSYTCGTLTMDILLMLRSSRFLYIIFFYFFYIIYILKIIKIYVLNEFITLIKDKNIIYIIINILELHYSLIMKVHLFKKDIYLNNNPSKYKFWRRYSVYNTFFFFNILYLKFVFFNLNIIMFNLYLWLFTYYTRFLIKIKYNKKLSIRYNVKKLKSTLSSKFSSIFNKIIDKIFQNYNIKMTIKYYYNKIKKYWLNLFNIIIIKIKKYLVLLKESYFKYFVNMVFLKILKNKGNLIIYYIFLFFKYLKSFFIWLWESDKISNFLKNFKRKKW